MINTLDMVIMKLKVSAKSQQCQCHITQALFDINIYTDLHLWVLGSKAGHHQPANSHCVL